MYKLQYRALGILMLALPLVAAILVSALQFDREAGKRTVVFFVEFAAIYSFGVFWFVKSKEISRTQQDQQALRNRDVQKLA